MVDPMLQPMQISFAILAILIFVLSLAGFASTLSQDDVAPSDLDRGVISTRTPVTHSSGSPNMQAGTSGANSEGTVTAPTIPELIEFAEELLAHMRSHVVDYRGTLIKRERIQGVLGGEVRMQFKVRNPQPQRGLAAYLKFESPSSTRGREVIWVENENENKLTVHEGGFKNLLRMQLAPESTLAMLGNKYPITEIGLLRLGEKLIEKCQHEVDLENCRVEIFDGQQVGGQPCRLIQVTQPESAEGSEFYIAQVFVDMQRMVPLRYAAFQWPEAPGDEPPLEEEYTYLDLELNVGLSDADFDPDNPDYQFP